MKRSILENYLQRHVRCPRWISSSPNQDLGMVVVIPALAETGLLDALNAIKACRPPDCSVEIIVVVNDPEKANPQIRSVNHQTHAEVLIWSRTLPPWLRCFAIYAKGLPQRKAGVGLARKIGMDEGLQRLYEAGRNRGIIVCFDADCTCRPDYLVEIHRRFSVRAETEALSIYFEHAYHDTDDSALRHAIIQYELHLRYLIQSQRYAGFPYAIHTVGSCIAVRARAYAMMGGMNTRKAGEDFYFLQKFMERGKVGILTSTCVYPGIRISDRVPFGTGKAMQTLVSGGRAMQTAHPGIFRDLKVFMHSVGLLYATGWHDLVYNGLPESVTGFLTEAGIVDKLQEIRSNVASEKQFFRRFFRWFNAFRLIKYMHYCRDRFYPDVDVETACRDLLNKLQIMHRHASDHDLLHIFRRLERDAEGK